MSDGSKEKVEKILDLSHMTSRISFEDWIRRNLKDKNGSLVYEKKEKIPVVQINKFLTFIRNEVKTQRVVDKKEWLERIKQIEGRVSEKE